MTGSTGFIGKNVAEYLVTNGHKVTSIIRNNTKKKIFKLNTNHVFITTSSMSQPSIITKMVSEADIILYCAGTIKGLKLRDFQEANIDLIKNIVEVAEGLSKKPQFILISSLAARSPRLSNYSLSKWKGERVLHNSSMNWVILRPTAVYGADDKELFPLLKMISKGLCPNFVQKSQKLSLLHVHDLTLDVAEIIQNFLKYNHKTIEIHDGKNDGYTWAEIARILRGKRAMVNIPVPKMVLIFLAIATSCLSIIVGYKPMLTLGKVKELQHPDWRCDNSLNYLETRLKNRITLDCIANGLH